MQKPPMAPQAPQEAPDQGDDNQVDQLVTTIGDGLAQLSQVLDASKEASDQDKMALQKITSMYGDLMSSLNKEPGEEDGPQGDMAMRSPEQGMNGIPEGPAGV